jgi:GH25 family lysozyme M1 (1,4-beta-N-acetylmuramidase)
MSDPAASEELRVVTLRPQGDRDDDARPLREIQAELGRAARDGDLVLLQGITTRCRPVAAKAFPAPEWCVYFGCRDNTAPIAFRTELLTKVRGEVTLLHPIPPVEHGRRYGLRLRLRARHLGSDLDVTNVHLDPDRSGDRAGSGRGGLDRHLALVEDLVAGGLPLVGGGDYGTELSDLRPLGDRVGGREIWYAVDSAATDHLWFVDGDELAWQVRSTRHSGGVTSADGLPPERGSRQAVVALASADALFRCSGQCDWCSGQRDRHAGGRDEVRHDRRVRGEDEDRPDDRSGERSRDHDGEDQGPRRDRRREREGRGDRDHDADRARDEDRRRRDGRDEWPDPFKRTTFGDGTPKPVDWKTRAALEEAERRLGYPLTVVQGSYNPGGVGASGGTHDLGGVVDLLPGDWQHKVRVLRELGFAAWHRPAISGLWKEHIHAVMVEHGKLSASARAQVTAYRAGRNGLVSNAADDFWRPDPLPVFRYPPRGRAGEDRGQDREPERDRDPDRNRSAEDGPRGEQQRPDRRRDQTRAPGPIPAYPPHRTLDGVDTSHFQDGRIDLGKAKAAGLRWWYVKATEGSSLTDPLYSRRVREARRASVPVGAYHFARPDGGDAREEAQFFVESTDIRVGDMLPMLDLESSEELSPAQLTTWTGTWVETVTRELASRGLRARPIIYTPFNLGKGFGCYLWVARYSDDFRAPAIPRPWRRAAIWQHSDGRYGPVKEVPGFGRVDVNALHPDVPLAALFVRSLADATGGKHAQGRQDGRRDRSDGRR